MRGNLATKYELRKALFDALNLCADSYQWIGGLCIGSDKEWKPSDVEVERILNRLVEVQTQHGRFCADMWDEEEKDGN
jgi:hypothetical protein